MIRDFRMNEVEAEAATRWVSAHVCAPARWWIRRKIWKHPSFTYSFTPTGIGDVVTISCHCGAKKDVTDYSSW